MQHKKETRPSLQAKGRAPRKSTHSLTQSAWERKWDEMGPATVAIAVAMFAILALGEAGIL